MAFDPTIPQNGTDIDAVEIRDQLNALNDRIVALEAALAGTAQNPNLGPLNIALSDPPTRPEVQQMLDFMNTLLNQITRV
jgi:hypothetical protein